MPSACVESCCDDPTCEICSPLPPLYDGMARNHRLNRRAGRGHGHGHGRHNHAGCSCGSCGGGEWFEGEIIEGEIIGGDGFGGCSSCTSCGDGMVMEGGMPMEMMPSGGCQSCQHDSMSGMPMMSGDSHEMHYEQQPTPAVPRSSAPSHTAPPSGSSVPEQSVPGVPMEQPMPPPMTSMRTQNYGAALFNAPPLEPKPYVPASSSTPIIYEQASPMPAPPAPPLASPASHAAPMYLAPPASSSMPALPAPVMSAEAQTQEVYVPASIPIQPRASAAPAAEPGKKPMRPFSEAAKPRRPAAQPQWEASLQMQTIQPAGGSLPPLP